MMMFKACGESSSPPPPPPPPSGVEARPLLVRVRDFFVRHKPDEKKRRWRLAVLEQRRRQDLVDGRVYASEKRELLAALSPAQALALREEQDEDMEKWIEKNLGEDIYQTEVVDDEVYEKAYGDMRRFVPTDVRHRTLESLEKILPAAIARRVHDHKTLWFVVALNVDVHRIHVADLYSLYPNHGLDLTEMRAIWYKMPAVFRFDPDLKKKRWRDDFKAKLDELEIKLKENRIAPQEKRHPAYDDDDHSHYVDPQKPLIPHPADASCRTTTNYEEQNEMTTRRSKRRKKV